VTVDDVDAALTRAEGLGGRVCVSGTDIPNVGRFGVLIDPGGGVVSPFEPLEAEGDSPTPAPRPGAFCWDELMTRELEESRSFYSEVFGWSHVEHDMGEMGPYTMFLADGEDRAGMMRMPPEAGETPAHWLAYVMVEDVDESAKRVEELGGRIFVPPRDIPGIGRFAVASDPTGAMFAVYKGAAKPE
jgi:predicted enzyme related to lactoylglutathione lyase